MNVAAKGEELAKAIGSLDALKEKQKAKNEEFNAKKQALQQDIKRLATQIETGQEELFEEGDDKADKKKGK